MRVLFFYQYFTTPKGSWSTRAYEFARRWVADGDDVTVVTSVYDKSDLDPSGLVDRMEIEGIDVRVINVRLSNKHGKLVRLITFFWFALVSSWYSLIHPADVVLASSGPITVGLPALIARYLRRRPLVFEVRDLWPEGAIQLGFLRSKLGIWLARGLEAACYRAAHTVVALSEGMRRDIRRRFPLVQVEVIPNACDVMLFGNQPNGNKRGDRENRALILYTGTLGRMDDCMQILRAAILMKNRNGENSPRFVFLGDGAERGMLEQYAEFNDLDAVEFMGIVPKTEVAEWLREACCSMVVFKNVEVLATSSPNKLFDALAAGVPVIQNTQGWIRDLLEAERCGLTVPLNDPVAMADAIERIVEDDTLREQMSENARRLAHERFDRDLLARRMHTVLRVAADS